MTDLPADALAHQPRGSRTGIPSPVTAPSGPGPQPRARASFSFDTFVDDDDWDYDAWLSGEYEDGAAESAPDSAWGWVLPSGLLVATTMPALALVSGIGFGLYPDPWAWGWECQPTSLVLAGICVFFFVAYWPGVVQAIWVSNRADLHGWVRGALFWALAVFETAGLAVVCVGLVLSW